MAKKSELQRYDSNAKYRIIPKPIQSLEVIDKIVPIFHIEWIKKKKCFETIDKETHLVSIKRIAGVS